MTTPEEKENELLLEIADALQQWDWGLSALGAREVLAWWTPDGTACIAFRGDALRIERNALMPEDGMNNHEWQLDVGVQKALGLDVEVIWQDVGRYQRRAVGVRGGAGQHTSEGSVHIGEFVSMVEDTVSFVFEEETGEDPPAVRVSLMPNEGSPWEFDHKSWDFYNAKKRQVQTTKRPKWLIEVEWRDPETGQEVMTIGADFCMLVDAVKGMRKKDRSYSMHFDSLIDLDILVTHSLYFQTYTPEDIAGYIRGCGGFLFPSLAVGHLPASNFGPVCLVLDPSLVLDGMKPYKTGRGAWPIITYDIDAWTGTMRDFLGTGSVEMFQQLTGSWSPSIYGQQHLWVLGPPFKQYTPQSEVQPIFNTKKLRSELRRRIRAWQPGMDAGSMEELRMSERPERYPFLEAKSNSIVAVGNISAAVYPVAMEDEVERFLRLIKSSAVRVPIDVTYPESMFDIPGINAWSWAVQDAVAALGKSVKVRF